MSPALLATNTTRPKVLHGSDTETMVKLKVLVAVVTMVLDSILNVIFVVGQALVQIVMVLVLLL